MTIKAKLVPERNLLEINQHITYYNHSKDTLHEIVLRNWANSYLNDETPLAKRLLEDYKTDFYFSKNNDRGYSLIHQITSNQQEANFHSPHHLQDLVFVNLSNPLFPNDSTSLDIRYTIKIPNAKFTGSGKKGIDFYLEDWHITPAIYHGKWQLDSHQNLNYQYKLPTDYNIEFITPVGYNIHSNFQHQKTIGDYTITHTLKGKGITQTNLSVTLLRAYLTVPTYPAEIITNFVTTKVDIGIQKVKMQQMMFFLNQHLSFLPHKKILIEKRVYNQNPIYELKYLPRQLHPYKNEFKWEAEFFKALVTQYVEQIVTINKIEDYWFVEGLEIYLFTKYMNQHYPEAKLLGRLSKVWGIKSMNIAKQSFNSKFNLVNQITARENLDQDLDTPYNKLSNYNKKVVSPYKAGIGFLYLKEYVGQTTLDNSIHQFISKYRGNAVSSKEFLKILAANTKKDISWFQKEWINTKKKIDHKVVTTDFQKDSVYITLKNKRSITTPVLVYGLKGKTIKSKTWIDGFKNTKNIRIKNDSLDKIVLNYENIYPEINYRNNWDNKKPKLFERPIQISLLKDLNNPRKNQVFLKPEGDYNYYDGFILGVSLQNKAFLHQNLEYAITPTFSTASKSLTGGFNVDYSIFPENTIIYQTNFGISGSNYHYAPDLNYNTVAPYFSLSFKQKDFRALGTNKITARFLVIDKEVAPGTVKTDEDDYHLFKLDYLFKMNKLIHNYQLNVNTEIASKFSKLNVDFRYKHLTNKKRPIEFRFYAGAFITNHTTSNYFSMNQHTANDYLFELPYLGRSETSGILSQQYFKSQGGFVSQNNPGFANQWLTSINTSVGIIRWVDAFNNISLLKNRHSSPFFDYETGIRLNFIPDILEFYLPIYNREGFVTQQDNYLNNVRFVVTLKAQPIIKFLKQQLF
ncbi:M1 family aminopeptidase [Wenyingzhuangia aestuarii]|uniref:M1 family aminopeptidase n=1 Tax=Wenyingzhuangia aestuarii TaxID=1647582 RepID=UPI001ADAA90E|nr:M1 family aminopeptidase [Wenyingzhuangia aestuarii]